MTAMVVALVVGELAEVWRLTRRRSGSVILPGGLAAVTPLVVLAGRLTCHSSGDSRPIRPAGLAGTAGARCR